MIPTKQAELVTPFESTRIVNPETDFVQQWLCWHESVMEDIRYYLLSLHNQPLTVEKLANFLKDTVNLELQNNRSYVALNDAMARMALRRVDWQWLAQNYLTCQN